LATLAMKEATVGVQRRFAADGLVDAKFATDLSCVFSSKHEDDTTILVRGVLLIHIPDDADIAAIQSKYGFGDIKAGAVYQSDIEVTVQADTLSKGVKTVGYYKFATLHA
ncbi:MAG: hypothetical protein RSE64_06175, partial [Oscillospiraceae bacterium]